jgi:hypothetical protein
MMNFIKATISKNFFNLGSTKMVILRGQLQSLFNIAFLPYEAGVDLTFALSFKQWNERLRT